MTILRFGTFELDVRSRELRCGGASVRLQEQPLEILRLMLERPGEVITRDELRQRLWPEGTFVDFEHSLNAAIKRLLAALGDDADKPSFIETVPRRGYRFVGSVPGARAVTAAPPSAPQVRLVVAAAGPADSDERGLTLVGPALRDRVARAPATRTASCAAWPPSKP